MKFYLIGQKLQIFLQQAAVRQGMVRENRFPPSEERDRCAFIMIAIAM
jgi:hypothetical protein